MLETAAALLPLLTFSPPMILSRFILFEDEDGMLLVLRLLLLTLLMIGSTEGDDPALFVLIS